jgi:thiol:disulfide interchange protein DsbD
VRPKEVTLTTAMVPASARPGETVELRVTAAVDEPWHIYAHAKEAPEDGPVTTQFDLFDLAGLEVAGDWAADREPIRKKEEAFDKLPFVEYFEKKVTWSIPLKVPANASAGDHELKVQVQFQICDPKSCKPPARVTAPPAKLRVSGGGQAQTRPAGTGRAIGLAQLVLGQVNPEPDGGPPAGDDPAKAETAPARGAANDPATEAEGQLSVELKAGGGQVQELRPVSAMSIGELILWSAGGGLLAVLMPCVWPMVPVTVNFFLKQSQIRKKPATSLAITYCLAIILVFTAVGLLAALLLGTTGATQLGSNGWLNLIAGLIFIFFGLSLLGLFELRLPTFLLNATASRESQGGLIGVVFMALTLTITSFTCTFPVVGALLVLATRGSYLYPIIGMLVFSTVLALPFFLLALAPGLLSRMPKSGDWMNTIKVVGGLVELGAAFKFLNTAEVGFGTLPRNAIFDSQVVLAIWVVLSAICGIYLLGLFRTDHDHGDSRIGAGRMLFGALFLAVAAYLTPALFGNPPRGKFYDLIVGILPQDSDELDQSEHIIQETVARVSESLQTAPEALVAQRGQGSGGSSSPGGGAILKSVKATSSDPKQAEREEKQVHGVAWGLSYEAALEQAKEEKKPILIDFTGVNCANCRTMERAVLPRSEVLQALRSFITIRLYTDRVPIESITAEQREDLAIANLEREAELTGETTSPLYVVLDTEGKVLGKTGFEPDPAKFLGFLQTHLSKFSGTPIAAAGASGSE